MCVSCDATRSRLPHAACHGRQIEVQSNGRGIQKRLRRTHFFRWVVELGDDYQDTLRQFCLSSTIVAVEEHRGVIRVSGSNVDRYPQNTQTKWRSVAGGWCGGVGIGGLELEFLPQKAQMTFAKIHPSGSSVLWSIIAHHFFPLKPSRRIGSPVKSSQSLQACKILFAFLSAVVIASFPMIKYSGKGLSFACPSPLTTSTTSSIPLTGSFGSDPGIADPALMLAARRALFAGTGASVK